MRAFKTALIYLLLTALSTASADERCKKFGKNPMVYAIGSSTLGMSLAPVIKRPLKKRGFRFRKWAKASSGLARPEFFDWAKQVPNVAKQWNPDIFLIVLGTNDFQSLCYQGRTNSKSCKDGKWVHPGKRWNQIYGDRVDDLLKKAVGPKRKRMVIWVGPNMIDTKRARYMARRITKIVRQRIKAFDGPVFFVDAYRPTSTRSGQPLYKFRLNKKKSIPTYEPDRVHLTRQVSRWVLARPVLRILDKCKKKQSGK